MAMAACGSPGGPGTPSSSAVSVGPVGLQAVFRWVPSGGLDLGSAEGTFVRAAMEATRFRRVTGTNDYPGFAEAIDRRGQSATSLSTDLGLLNAYVDSPTGGFTGGVFWEWVGGVERGDDQSVSVIVCEDLRDTFYVNKTDEQPRFPGMKYEYSRGGTEAYEVGFVRSGKAPPVGQRGPKNIPVTSRFGQWRFVRFDQRVDWRDRCDASQPPNLRSIHHPEGLMASPPPQPGLAPSPGWPVGGE